MPLMMSLAVRGEINAMMKNTMATPAAPITILFNLLPFLVGCCLHPLYRGWSRDRYASIARVRDPFTLV